jgi:AGZA family xanthine/uracil permease-like MFS transporter
MRFFVKRDLDGFCGLFVDNLVQLLMIVSLGGGLCGMSRELLSQVVLPGTAISILVGNLFYGWQAMRLAKRTNRHDVTALPASIRLR